MSSEFHEKHVGVTLAFRKGIKKTVTPTRREPSKHRTTEEVCKIQKHNRTIRMEICSRKPISLFV